MSFMGFLADKGLARRTIWTKVQVLYSPNSIDTARLHGSGAEVRIPRMAYNMSLAN
jgi:hypothetical protein